MRVPRLPLLLAATLAAPTASQVLIGGANQGGAPVIEYVLPGCAAITMCTSGLPLPAVPFAGGTAYDPTRQVVFDTEGTSLVGVSVFSGAQCQITCSARPVPGLPAGAVATGLAFELNALTGDGLWCVDSHLGLQKFTWQTRSCPGPGTRCSIAPYMPTANHRPGGLAVSEAHGLIFYSASNFSGGAPDNWVFAAPLGSPCQPGCRLQVSMCGGVPMGPITGLAFDDCLSNLFVTDGTNTLVATFIPVGGGLACQLVPTSCCPPTLSSRYGLCVMGQHPTSVGTSCLAAPCPSCPNLALAALGDPVLGNSSFGFRIENAPPGMPAACLLAPGACTAGVPLFCGLLHLPLAPPPVSLGTVVTVGGPCAGVAYYSLPVPLNPALCGVTLSAQGLIVCPGSPFGTGLTNAVCLTVADS